MNEMQRQLIGGSAPGVAVPITSNTMPSFQDPAGSGSRWIITGNQVQPTTPGDPMTIDRQHGYLSNAPVNHTYAVKPWGKNFKFERYLREGQCIFIARQMRDLGAYQRLDQLQTIVALHQLNKLIQYEYNLAVQKKTQNDVMQNKIAAWGEERLRAYLRDEERQGTLDESDKAFLAKIQTAPWRYLYCVTIADHWNFGGIIRSDPTDPTRISSGRNNHTNITVTIGKNIPACSNVWGDVPMGSKVYFVLTRPHGTQGPPQFIPWFETEGNATPPLTKFSFEDVAGKIAYGCFYCIGTADAGGTRRKTSETTRIQAANIGGGVGEEQSLAKLQQCGTVEISVGV